MSDDSSDEKERPLVAKTAVDLQRLKLMKLMKNPDKPIIVPDRPKAKNIPSVPEFVRNVMGSSAGAGSGEFHVYRHLRRKEYARQKFIQEKSQKEILDEEYHKKLEENQKLADELTAKKRAKRLKKKQKLKLKKKFKPNPNKNKHDHEDDSDKTDSDHESSDEEKINISVIQKQTKDETKESDKNDAKIINVEQQSNQENSELKTIKEINKESLEVEKVFAQSDENSEKSYKKQTQENIEKEGPDFEVAVAGNNSIDKRNEINISNEKIIQIEEKTEYKASENNHSISKKNVYIESPCDSAAVNKKQ